VLEDVADVNSQIDLRDRARGVNGTQNIEHRAAIASFSELRAREHTFLDSQCALDAIIRIMKIGIAQILREFTVVLDNVATRKVKLGVWWPNVRPSTRSVCRSAIDFSSRRCDGAVFKRQPRPFGVASTQFQDRLLGTAARVDAPFNFREQPKAPEHVIAKTSIFVFVAPKRTPGMRSTSGNDQIKTLHQLSAWQIACREIALKDQSLQLRTTELKGLTQQIADRAHVRAKKSNRTVNHPISPSGPGGFFELDGCIGILADQ